MKCPYCGWPEQKVLESRPARDGLAIRRRRQCMSCGRRFNTFEGAERPRLFVVKRDGGREEFAPTKLLRGLETACHKRSVPHEALAEAVARIERALMDEYEDEAPSSAIGELALQALHRLDAVAFVRFASVYREFETPQQFTEIVDEFLVYSQGQQGSIPASMPGRSS